MDSPTIDGQLEEIIQDATTEVRRRGMEATDRAINVALLGAILRLLIRIEDRLEVTPVPRRRERRDMVVQVVIKVAPAGLGAAFATLVWYLLELVR